MGRSTVPGRSLALPALLSLLLLPLLPPLAVPASPPPGRPAAATAAARPAPLPDSLLTRCERSGGRETSRYEEAVALCRRLDAASDRLRFTSFGTSPRGRPLPLLIADRHGRFTPEAARRGGGVVLLVQAGIHAGEICGKDAGLALLRDLALGVGAAAGPDAAAAPGDEGAGPAGLPERVTILFIPILNVDGHERFGPYNRVNQNGPAEMGWRTNARNLNLNRDFLKADAVETRAWLDLFTAWLPDFLIDVHSTDGADYQYPVSYSLETNGNLETGLTAWLTGRYLPALERGMAAAGHPLIPYVAFRDWHDPASGLMSWVASPRFSQGYAALQNRPGLLVETHMLKPYPVRVAAAREVVARTLTLLDGQADELRRLVEAADRQAAAGDLPRPFPLRFRARPDSQTIDFLGVAYREVRSELTGGTWLRFEPDRPVTLRIPWFDRQEPTVTVEPPAAYLVPPEWGEVLDRLARHGVALGRLAEPVTLAVRSYRFGDPSWAAEPYEGRHPLTCAVEPLREERTFPAGTAVVDLRQRAARVAVHALEPEAPDSFLQWGFFDPVFSRAEYIEDYVIEPMAARMVAEDPDLAAELARRKAEDPEFAADPRAIRDWFYRRTPYRDDRVGVYPVGLLDDPEAVDALPLAGP